jgi:hypothetical protein
MFEVARSNLQISRSEVYGSLLEIVQEPVAAPTFFDEHFRKFRKKATSCQKRNSIKFWAKASFRRSKKIS